MNYLPDAWFSSGYIFLYSSPLLQTGNGLEFSKILIKSRGMIAQFLLLSNFIFNVGQSCSFFLSWDKHFSAKTQRD